VNNKKKKVLFVATVDSHIELFHLPYLKMFKDKGYEVHVATNTDKKIQYCDKKHKISIERNPFKLNNLKAIRELKKNVNAEKFDIIHCHTPMGGVVARLAAKKARKHGTRMIYTAHGFHFFKGAPLKNWLLFYPVEKYLAKYTDTLITINTEDFERAKKKFGKRCKDIHMIDGIGVDFSRFDKKMSNLERKKKRAELGIKNTDFVIIYAAEVSKRKRQIWLLDRLKNYLKSNKTVHVILVGKDSLSGLCHEYVKMNGLGDQVHILGFRKDIVELYKISDMSISAASQEGLGLNMVEALYCGLPVIMSDNRGHREISAQKIEGIVLLDDNFRKESVKFIEKIRNNANKQYASDVRRFALENVVKEMEAIYEH